MAALRSQIPNALSLYRIPAAAAFLVIYSPVSRERYLIAMAIAASAIASDIADGLLARHWKVTSQTGYFLDGIGDKSFYVAVLLVMTNEQISNAFLAWGLLVREILLYALRSIDANMWSTIGKLRALSRYHALFIRLYFLCFVATDGARLLLQSEIHLFPYADALGYTALSIGLWSAVSLISAIASED